MFIMFPTARNFGLDQKILILGSFNGKLTPQTDFFINSKLGFQTKTPRNLEDEEFLVQTKISGYWKHHEHSRFKRIFSENVSPSRKPLHTFCFAKHQKSSIFNTDLLQIGINPGSDCEISEIRPTLGGYISELKRS